MLVSRLSQSLFDRFSFNFHGHFKGQTVREWSARKLWPGRSLPKYSMVIWSPTSHDFWKIKGFYVKIKPHLIYEKLEIFWTKSYPRRRLHKCGEGLRAGQLWPWQQGECKWVRPEPGVVLFVSIEKIFRVKTWSWRFSRPFFGWTPFWIRLDDLLKWKTIWRIWVLHRNSWNSTWFEWNVNL